MREEHQTDSRRVKHILAYYMTANFIINVLNQYFELKTAQSSV